MLTKEGRSPWVERGSGKQGVMGDWAELCVDRA